MDSMTDSFSGVWKMGHNGLISRIHSRIHYFCGFKKKCQNGTKWIHSRIHYFCGFIGGSKNIVIFCHFFHQNLIFFWIRRFESVVSPKTLGFFLDPCFESVVSHFESILNPSTHQYWKFALYFVLNLTNCNWIK